MKVEVIVANFLHFDSVDVVHTFEHGGFPTITESGALEIHGRLVEGGPMVPIAAYSQWKSWRVVK
jgi:hypothetical protein